MYRAGKAALMVYLEKHGGSKEKRRTLGLVESSGGGFFGGGGGGGSGKSTIEVSGVKFTV